MFQQTIGELMNTDLCAPLFADLFLYLYEVELIKTLLKERKNYIKVSTPL